MINSTNTVNIDGVTLKEFDVNSIFTIDENDKFSRWVVRPLAVLSAIGIGVAAVFASAMLIVVSLALLPVLAIAMWAMRTKLERDLQTTVRESSPVDADEQADNHGLTAN